METQVVGQSFLRVKKPSRQALLVKSLSSRSHSAGFAAVLLVAALLVAVGVWVLALVRGVLCVYKGESCMSSVDFDNSGREDTYSDESEGLHPGRHPKEESARVVDAQEVETHTVVLNEVDADRHDLAAVGLLHDSHWHLQPVVELVLRHEG